MKKIIKIFFITILLMLLLCIGAQAVPEDSGGQQTGFSDLYDSQMEASGADELKDSLPEETKELLREFGIDDLDYNNFINISPTGIFDLLFKIITGKISNPLTSAAIILGVILLCSMVEGFKTPLNEKVLGGVYGAVSSLAIVVVLIAPILDCITHTCSAIQICSDFMLVFIPVITAILSISGNPITASGYNLIVFSAAELISRFSASTLTPLICIYFSFCVVGGISANIHFDKISESVKKGVNLALGFCGAVFTGVLTIQGMVSASADTVATKTAKFMVSSFVPVVGGAISEGLTTVNGCMGLVKSTAGAYGIIAAAFIFLPVIVELLLWILTLHLCEAAGDLFHLDGIARLLKGIRHTLSVLLSIVLFCGVLLIISAAVVVSVRSGA